MRTREDGVWRYYNCPDPHWSDKCRCCREKVAGIGTPVEECVNCWKIEIWGYEPDEQDRLVGMLMQRGVGMRSGGQIIAKASRAPILVVRTGMPPETYPSMNLSYLLMLYAESIEERELLRHESEVSIRLPVRRGCWRYDDVLGPWQSWYPVDEDWKQGP